MIRLSAVEILSFLIVFGLVCFGLGVLFMQYRRMKTMLKDESRLLGKLAEMEREFREGKNREETSEGGSKGAAIG